MVEKDNRVFIEWSDVDDYINNLIKRYKDKNITGVYGIPRGGLVLATLLSYKMDIPLLAAPTKNCIIIDDIADSGKSLSHYTENDTQFNLYHITTMFYKERSIVLPEVFYSIKTDEWIVFPWENQETEKDLNI